MRRALILVILAVLPAAAQPAPSPAGQWWSDIAALADDSMQGRLTGSPGYAKAAAYVTARLKAEGLAPTGVNGFLQPVAFQEQKVDQDASTATLIAADGSTTSLTVGKDLLITAGAGPRPASVEAPLVFIGYGLSLPAQGHDDLAGLDLKGKIAVVLSGGPDDIPGPVKSDARSNRNRALARRGAVGVIALTTPRQVEILWERQRLLARGPGMYLADKTLRETPDCFFTATADPGNSEIFFQGTGHSFAELSALSDASRPLPRMALGLTLKAGVKASYRRLTSPNIVAKLTGRDPLLKAQYVVVSAHLDHLGVGEPIKGDAIYNGAMDDASGVASVLDIAHRLKNGAPLRRSVLFVLFTAEEKGLLGSDYFVRHPTEPKAALVADMNFDMPLPLWPLTEVYLPGETESSLGDDARIVAAAQGLRVVPDPNPDRNVFVRADQYSFVRQGIPALFFKFGFEKGTPQFQIEHDWRANRYHSPSDDLDQPGILKDEAVKLDDYAAALTRRVADADARPAWRPGSIFAK